MAASSVRLAAVFGGVFIVVLVPFARAIGEDSFQEELFIKPLSSGHVYAHFQFTTTWNVSLKDESKLRKTTSRISQRVLFDCIPLA